MSREKKKKKGRECLLFRAEEQRPEAGTEKEGAEGIGIRGTDVTETSGREDFEKGMQVPHHAQCFTNDREDDAAFQQMMLVTDLGKNPFSRMTVIEARSKWGLGQNETVRARVFYLKWFFMRFGRTS